MSMYEKGYSQRIIAVSVSQWQNLSDLNKSHRVCKNNFSQGSKPCSHVIDTAVKFTFFMYYCVLLSFLAFGIEDLKKLLFSFSGKIM